MLGEQIPVLLAGRHRVDDHLLATFEHQHHGLQQPGMGVEAEPKLAKGRTIVQRLNPKRPLSGLLDVLSNHAVLESAGVDLHAAKCASAARIASERLRSALRGSVQSFQLLGGQPHRNHLGRFRPTPRTPTPASRQLGDVVAGIGFLGPLLDLLITHHNQIV